MNQWVSKSGSALKIALFVDKPLIRLQ